ncbi:MAG TPA: DUF192 domain-containing protein [Acidimicrobiales bacterium]
MTTAPGTTVPTASSSVRSSVVPPVVPEGFEAVVLRVVAADGTVSELCVLLAATDGQRAQGLMGVTSLGGYDGMLFDFGGTVSGRFWMRDTLIPLSIAFFDEGGALVSTTDMEPCPATTSDADCPRYGAARPFARALEVAQGDLERLGIEPGVRAASSESESCSRTAV